MRLRSRCCYIFGSINKVTIPESEGINKLKMKVALFILVVLPLVFCAPSEIDRRWLIDVHAVVDQLKHLITPDMTESACTTVCESVISGIGLLVCPSACNILVSSLNGK
ncbi:uncharacterized protein LOC128155920 [Crassostrea angulata]|uniref:uncharacterized protein LOC128155920 n=1 Tax=Magallana angulata TaxID=2784310 RepID=UPI0022B16B9F|nr:uncharacterized protein LOC128155920 [Crassostrea angulata]